MAFEQVRLRMAAVVARRVMQGHGGGCAAGEEVQVVRAGTTEGARGQSPGGRSETGAGAQQRDAHERKGRVASVRSPSMGTIQIRESEWRAGAMYGGDWHEGECQRCVMSVRSYVHRGAMTPAHNGFQGRNPGPHGR